MTLSITSPDVNNTDGEQIMTNEKEYIPFGDEWASEAKKNSKDIIIQILRKVCIENQELQKTRSSIERETVEKCKDAIKDKVLDFINKSPVPTLIGDQSSAIKVEAQMEIMKCLDQLIPKEQA